MNLIICPHCKSHRVLSARPTPKDVVVVMPCPACNELMVLFRKKVIALDRRILEEGTMDERKSHLAGIIAEFIEPGMFRPRAIEDGEDLQELFSGEVEYAAEGPLGQSHIEPISEREIKRFIELDLKRIDDSSYFKRHFG